jgi:hyperosmotically inducible protein
MNTLAALRLARRVVAGAILVGIIGATAGSAAQMRSPLETTWSVRRALERLPYYGVFDYLAFGVDRGTVTLSGYAYTGSLRSAAERAAKRTSGVDEVANRLEILPASHEDDRIRWVTFYRIYTDAFLSRYASGGDVAVRRAIYEARRFPGMYQPLGLYSIHIVVRHGHTTLFGVVDNDGDRQIAEMRAREVTGVFSVANEITVAKKAAKK